MDKKGYPNSKFNPNFIEDGLVMHFDAARATGTTVGSNRPTTTWQDLSGNNFNGALSHFGTTRDAWASEALAFNGTSDYVEITNNGIGKFDKQEFTIEVWTSLVKASGPIFAYDYYVTSPPFCGTHFRISTVGETTRFIFGFNIEATYREINAIMPPGFIATNLNQFVCTFKSGEQKVYLNGVELATANHEGTITYFSTPVYIGRSTGVAGYFHGSISIVRYYNRALSAEQVTTNYISGIGDIVLPENYINVKEYGAEGNGKTDDTEAIQNAINAAADYYIEIVNNPDGTSYTVEKPKEAKGGGNIYIPEGVYMIEASKAVEMRSRANLYMSGKAVLQAKPNDYMFYTIVGIRRVENVKVYGGNIRGDRNEHTGSSGQWGMGISIVESYNFFCFV